MKRNLILLTAFISALSFNTYGQEIVFVQGAHFDNRSFSQLLTSSPMPNVRSHKFVLSSHTLGDYAHSICSQLRPGSILAGHSQGGAVINQAFGICPDKIKSLIYIAGTIPFPGEKPFDLFGHEDEIYYNRAVSEGGEGNAWYQIVNPKAFIEAFAQDATNGQKAYILSLAKHEPKGPSLSSLKFDLQKFQRLKKLVILTENDRVITLATQNKYASRLKMVETKTISSGHMPMVTQPGQVWKHILEFTR